MATLQSMLIIYQEGVLHGIFEFAPLREPDLKLVLAHGRHLSARHSIGARQNCQKSTGNCFFFFFFLNISGLLLKGILIITISEIRMTNKKNMLANFQPYKLNFSISFNLN
jgi:hypothetical protein